MTDNQNPARQSKMRWRPIERADKSTDRIYDYPGMPRPIGNSEEYWCRDADGRVFLATWADDGKRACWWDLEGESPVDPVEFMPHPLDPRWAATTEGQPCRVCGNEERGQGGYLSCECPSPQSKLEPIGFARKTNVAALRDGLQGSVFIYQNEAGDLEPIYAGSPAPEKHVRVKPLEWRALDVTDREAAVADSILGEWEVWHFPGGKTYITKPGEHQGTVYEDGYEEAKAYLERVYQRRLAPALTTEGQP